MGNPDSDIREQNRDKDENLVKNVSPRETIINHAVTFLLDKKISDQDPALLRQFLIRKGLTEDEVLIAFRRHETLKNQKMAAVFGQHQSLVQHYVPLQPPTPSMWHTVHRTITTITSIGGIVYAIYWFWKNYISPYLFGRKPKKKPLETTLEELGTAVNDCVADVKTIRSSLDTLATEKATELTQGVLVTRIQEVKSEIKSLKSLLLNRNQFPATPAPLGTGPLLIPSWQMGAEEQHQPEGEEEGSGSNGGTNGSDSSLEIVK